MLVATDNENFYFLQCFLSYFICLVRNHVLSFKNKFVGLLNGKNVKYLVPPDSVPFCFFLDLFIYCGGYSSKM